MNIAASHSDKPEGILYTRIVKSLLIILIVPSERRPFSFIAANTYFNNTTILAI